MMEKVIEAIRNYDLLSKGDFVVCALSGGADSIAMTHVLQRLKDKFGIDIAAAHLNHRLRGGESDRDEKFVREFCENAGIPVYIEQVEVSKCDAVKKSGLEAAARGERYRFLQRAAKHFGATKIATAHTADDNIETILLNLTRGSGLSGLCGIPPKRENIIRPMLLCSRAEIEGYCEENALGFVQDSTNLSDVYTRNRIRHQVVPVLKEINPNLCETASNMANLLRGDAEALLSITEEAMAYAEKSAGKVMYDIIRLKEMPEAVCGRIVAGLYKMADGTGELSYAHISKILQMLSSTGESKAISLPGGVYARRQYDKLIFSKRPDGKKFGDIPLAPGTRISLEEAGLFVACEREEKTIKINNFLKTFYFDCDKINGNLQLRSRREGDKISLLNREGSKTLKKLFIEMKIPKEERGLIPVISDDSGVAAVYGIGVDRRFAEIDSGHVLCIRIEEKPDAQ